MKKETLEFIRNSFVTAMQMPCKDIPDIEQQLVELLEIAEIPDEDIPKMDFFLAGLRDSISTRAQTMDYTELCADIMHATVYIIIWINEFHPEFLDGKDMNEGLDVHLSSRRKALDSELPKRLEKADKLVPPNIDDMFGIRYVISNPQNSIFLSCVLAQKIFNILCNFSRKDRESFVEFIKNEFNIATQARILRVLEIPFQLKEIRRSDSPEDFRPEKFEEYHFELPTDTDRKILKNFGNYMKFYFDPKKNGYQSIHFVLEIPSASKDMPGAKIEIQFRTENMDYYANNIIGKSHKDKVELYKKFFRLSKAEVVLNRIRAFFGYSVYNDLDGLHNPKQFYSRRINRQSYEKSTYNRNTNPN